MFAIRLKQVCNNITKQKFKHTCNFIQFDDKFKETISTFLKEQNIKHFTMSVDYNFDNLEYSGNICAERFTPAETEKLINNNELDYYIKMSNEFARKN